MDKHFSRAIFCALSAVFCLFMMNVMGKMMKDTFQPLEIVFWRNFISTLILIPFVLYVFRFKFPPMGKPKMMLARGVMGSMTLVFSTYAYFHLPLADANAIILSAPLILVLLAGPLLNENVSRTRLMCTVVGLAGVLMVAQPSGAVSLMGTGAAIIAAISVAMMRVMLRHLGKTEDPLSMTFYFLAIGAVFTFSWMPFVGKTPPFETIPLLILMGICGALGQYLNALSYKYGDASFVGIFVYSQLIWAIPFDYFLWDHAPYFYTIMGGIVIAGSNIMMIFVERRRRRIQSAIPA